MARLAQSMGVSGLRQAIELDLRRAYGPCLEDEMVAYWVARSKVNDPEQYQKYADLAPPIIGKFGGKFLARGGKCKILEGPEKFHRFIVIDFPSFEKAVGCHEFAQIP